MFFQWRERERDWAERKKMRKMGHMKRLGESRNVVQHGQQMIVTMRVQDVII